MFASLRSRLALSNLAITLIAVLVLTVIFAQLLRQHSIDVQQSEVKQQATQLQRYVNSELALVRAGKVQQLGPFYSYLSHASKILDKRIILFSSAGSCAFDSAYFKASRSGNPLSGCNGSSANRWQLASVQSHQAVSRFLKLGSRTYLVTQRPTIGISPARPTAVVLVTDASAVTPSWTAIAPAFLLAVLAAAIVWVFMGIYFAYTVSRPLGRITEAARAMAAGDYTQRVEVKSVGEIGEAARSFNHMATQVKESHQLLRDFVANVSHDLRTPITLISGYAGTLLDGTARTPDEAREAAQVVSDEAARMQRLVDDLLQLTRLESGLRKFEQKPVSVRDLVAKTVQRTSAASDGCDVVNSVSEHLPLALADEELVERVLMNLLNNAREHTSTDGKVEVSARAPSGWIEISVSDTGSGISKEEQGRIFERFYRSDRGRSRDDGHSGLGLPIVKEIVEAHGGVLDVESEPGRGSTFRFTVPSFSPQSGIRP